METIISGKDETLHSFKEKGIFVFEERIGFSRNRIETIITQDFFKR